MNKLVKSASNMFFSAGVLWVLEAVGEMFGGYVEDFNSIFDYLSEATFGLYFAVIFMGALYLTKSHMANSAHKLGWVVKIGRALLGLGAVLMTSKALINVVYHGFGGEQFLFAEGGPLSPVFLIGILFTVLGTIIYGIGCMTGRVLPWWVSLLFVLSFFLVFVPVAGKFVAAALYALIGAQVLKKQEKTEDLSNNFVINK